MSDGWSNEATRPAGAGSPRPVGARFHAETSKVEKPGAPLPPEKAFRFTVVVRGYERRQVDARLAELDAEIGHLRGEIDGWQRRWRAVQEHSAGLEAELRDRRTTPLHVDAGATPIADRVLRHARMEAATIRAVAARDAEAMRARARSEVGASPGSDDPDPEAPPQVQAS